MKLSVNYLRTIVKNCNAAIRLSSDSSDVQRLTMRREIAFTAIRMLQDANKGNRSIDSVKGFCANNGIQFERTSGKSETTWKADEFGEHLKSRFTPSYLSKVADKQESGEEFHDVAVVQNLGDQYGRTVHPPKDKVKHVAPSIPSKYKDRVERASDGSIRTLGREMPRKTTETAFSVEAVLCQAERLHRAGKDKRAKKLAKLAKAAITSQAAVRLEREQERVTRARMARDVVLAASPIS
jgi:hypothetical protein